MPLNITVRIPLLLILFLIQGLVYSQVKYSGKFEAGYLNYQHQLVMVDADPGSGGKGYYLNNKQDGIDLNLINGVAAFDNRLFTGVGLGYQNYEGISGFAVFGNFEYIPLKSKLSPIIEIKIGYDHIWNQYEGGTGTALSEIVAGINYKLSDKVAIYLKSGMLFTQQSSLIPIRIGIRL